MPPLAALAVALPVAPPLQSTLVFDAIVIANGEAGWVIVTVVVPVHPPLSVTVIV